MPPLIPRTGRAPLRVEDPLFASVSTRGSGTHNNRWYEIAIYGESAVGPADPSYGKLPIPTGLLTCHVGFRSLWQGETDHDWAETFRSPVGLSDWLETLDPIPERIGYPEGEAHADRQAKLLATLRRQYAAAVSEILTSEFFAVKPKAADREFHEREKLARYEQLLAIGRAGLDLSEAEASLICEAENGTMLIEDQWRFWRENVEDAIRLDRLDQKWEVDAKALLAKIRQYDDLQRLAVAEACLAFWRDHVDDETAVGLRAVGLIR